MINLKEASVSKKISVPRSTRVRVKKERVLNYQKALLLFSRIKPRYLDLGLLVPVIAIAVFGVAMVYSASWYNASIYFNDKFHFFRRQLIGLLMGIVMLSLTYHIDYRVYKKRYVLILTGAVFLMLLVFVPGIGMERFGARRWIGIGGFSIQPSEIAKFAFIIFAATIASGKVMSKPSEGDKTKPGMHHLSIKQFLIILAAGGGLCALILMQPNLSITLTLGATMILMLFLCGARIKHLLVLMLPVLVVFPILLVAEPYRVERLVAFIDPWSNPRDEGFQLIQSLFSLGNGGLFGQGYLNSTQKYMFLPFSESDFIFSIIGEEFGLVGTIIFLATIGWIVTKIFKIGKQCNDYFGKFLCFGIGGLIFIQSMVNIAVVTGSIPPTGLPLPFVSFGGTSLAVFMGAIGIILNIDKNNKKS